MDNDEKGKSTAALKKYYHMDSFSLQCDCGSEILELVVDKDEYEGYWELYEMSFGTYQKPFISNLKENLRLIWAIIRGKRYWFYGIIITKEQMDAFKEFVAGIDKPKDKEEK